MNSYHFPNNVCSQLWTDWEVLCVRIPSGFRDPQPTPVTLQVLTISDFRIEADTAPVNPYDFWCCCSHRIQEAYFISTDMGGRGCEQTDRASGGSGSTALMGQELCWVSADGRGSWSAPRDLPQGCFVPEPCAEFSYVLDLILSVGVNPSRRGAPGASSPH